jgi:hypothetical protein
MNTMKACLLVASSLIAAVSSNAQGGPPSTVKIPVKQLGAITAASKDSMGLQVNVRALPNGSVLVNDAGRRRVLMFDAMLAHATSVIDSASGNGTSISSLIPSAQLIRYGVDSTLFVDVATQALLVIDPNGKIAHVMALPRPRDATFLAIALYGAPAMDPRGRLVYRGVIIPQIKPPDPTSRVMFSLPQQPDSGPIVRADFDTRSVDTIATMKILQPGSMTMTQDGQGNVAMQMVVNPMDTGDEWAMLPDGTVAIVRAHDYHIDWINPDGTRRSSEKMPFDWKRVTDEQKQFKLDSMRPLMQKAVDGAAVRTIPTADGPRKMRIQFDFVPISKLPDYEPPISPGSVKADLIGNLWIVPRTSASATVGVLYDVVNSQGVITHRVQFPKGYALAGFGPNGDVYVLRVDGKVGFLEKAKAP